MVPLSSGSAAPKKARHAARRSILDYYRLLPSRYFEGDNRSELLRKDSHPLIDLKNDYLEIQGDGDQAALQIAVFRYHGRDTVAVSTDRDADYDVSRYSFGLLRYEGQRWRSVTNDLSPIVDHAGLRFKLPRHGTTVQVYRENGTHLANLYWDKGAFSAESFDPSRHP